MHIAIESLNISTSIEAITLEATAIAMSQRVHFPGVSSAPPLALREAKEEGKHEDLQALFVCASCVH